MLERNIHQFPLPHSLNPGMEQQPRHVPNRNGMERETLPFVGRRPSHRATPVRARGKFLKNSNITVMRGNFKQDRKPKIIKEKTKIFVSINIFKVLHDITMTSLKKKRKNNRRNRTKQNIWQTQCIFT